MAKKSVDRLGLWVSGLSLVGLVASFWQTAEKIHMLQNPDAPLDCNINPIVDCGTVLNHDLSSVFGVPNSMIGMVVFSMLFMTGLLMMSGMVMKPHMKRLVLALTLVLFGFAVWFFAVSLYVIGKICIFCIFIWGAAMPLAVLMSGKYGDQIFPQNKLVKWKLDWFRRKPWQPVLLIYGVMVALFLIRFRDYYFG